MEIIITRKATKIKWYMLNYPKSNISYWELLNDEDEIILIGNTIIPPEVIENWGLDDTVIEKYLLEVLEKKEIENI